MKHKRSTFREQRRNRDKHNISPTRKVANSRAPGGRPYSQDQIRAALVNEGMKYLMATMPKPHTDIAASPDERVRLAVLKRASRGARFRKFVHAGGMLAV